MPLDAITHETVRDTLRALRYANPVSRSPLLYLDLVSVGLQAEDLADTWPARSWVLGRRLEEAVDAELRRVRGPQDAPVAVRLTAGEELVQLRQDLQSGSAERLDWALVHWRYFSATRQPAGEVSRGLGMSERTVHNRVARGVAALAERLRHLEVEASRRLMGTMDASLVERIIVDEQAEPRNTDEVLGALTALTSGRAARMRATPAQLEAAARRPVADLTAYRSGRIAEWSQPRYRLDNRFVELSLLVDLGEESQSGRWQAKEERFTDLRDALAAVNEPAVVLLGPPGSGKSTLLRRLELDLACDALSTPGLDEAEGNAPPLTFFISLNQFRPPSPGSPLPPPWEWLAERWAASYPQMPSLPELSRRHRFVFLLDGLNELPHHSAEEYRARIALWKQFLHETVTPGSGHRAVIACRSLDYSAPLSTPAMRVPQVQLEPLTDEKVEAFLRRYSPEHAAALWGELRGTAVLGALRWPFFLRLVVEAAAESGRWEGDLAGLFTAYVRRTLVREIERHNPRLEPNGLLDERDYERIASGRGWRHAYELPERGALFHALSELAHGMQEAAVDSESSQVRIGYAEAVELLGGGQGDDDRGKGLAQGADGRESGGGIQSGRSHDAAAAIHAGAELGLLDEDRAADEVMFQHQLLQEYFAARKMAREPRMELVRAPWRAAEIRPGLREILDTLLLAEALPALPTSGWEETVLMAAAMSLEPEAFIRQVMAMNLALAGRAANLPAVRPRLGSTLLDELRWALARRSRDREADLRARIEAGLALGSLGDPRFLRRDGPHGTYLLPPMVEIPGGEYPIGDNDPIESEGQFYADHVPRHTVGLGPFAIGQFAVTNAEYACFIAAGGYEDERWWETEGAKAWRRGEGTAEGLKRNHRWWWREFRAHPERIAAHIEDGRFDEATAQYVQSVVVLDEADFEAVLAERIPGGRLTEPHFWNHARYNNPAQPVVGVCWYEARAYCAWLTAQTSVAYSLPTEVEREAATRGQAGRRFAYGDAFDPLAGNVTETHVRQPSPAGVFVEGDTPEGVSDLAGNSADWTSSLYGRSDDEAEYRYPYDARDGREDASAGEEVRRVLRGGMCRATEDNSLAVARDAVNPGYRSPDFGFRLRSIAPVSPL